MATFKINGVFQITDRGYVLAGEIMEGEITPGNLIHLSFNEVPTALKIKLIEYIDHLGNKAEIGLIIGALNESVPENIKEIIGQTVSIT
jgi:translation elongation factor EF-Tu-like GTPase